MSGTVRRYFARGNTARGVYELYDSAFQGLNQIYLLQGPAGTGKSTILKRLADEWARQGEPIELFHSPLNPSDLDAIILSDSRIGIADGRKCGGLSERMGSQIIPIDFGQAFDRSKVTEIDQTTINLLNNQLQDAYTRATNTFAAALIVHDDLERIYIDRMDFAKGNQIAQELIDSFFGDRVQSKQAAVRHLFFGAATPIGAVDHIQNLTADMKRRIFIKGRPGSGKSTMLKSLASASESRGFDVQVFHCGFDPNSLDMLIFPELSLAIFDSTAPHEYDPSRVGDEILDMYERTIEPGTDEYYASELDPIYRAYKSKMKEATAYLAKAREFDSRMKACHVSAVDFLMVDRLYDQLRGEIQSYSQQNQFHK
jgi:energy-coupling factor transporter ATP-binding protein EcfA2